MFARRASNFGDVPVASSLAASGFGLILGFTWVSPPRVPLRGAGSLTVNSAPPCQRPRPFVPSENKRVPLLPSDRGWHRSTASSRSPDVATLDLGRPYPEPIYRGPARGCCGNSPSWVFPCHLGPRLETGLATADRAKRMAPIAVQTGIYIPGQACPTLLPPWRIGYGGPPDRLGCSWRSFRPVGNRGTFDLGRFLV